MVIATGSRMVPNETPGLTEGAEFFYTDEIVVDDRLKPTGTQYKPAYDPVLLTGVNYINHLSVYRAYWPPL